MSETNTQNNTTKIVIGGLVAAVLCYLALRYMSEWSGGAAGILSILVGVIVAVLLWIGLYPKAEPNVPDLEDADSKPMSMDSAPATTAAPTAAPAPAPAPASAPKADAVTRESSGTASTSAIPSVAAKPKAAAPVAETPAAPKVAAKPKATAKPKTAAPKAAAPKAAAPKPKAAAAKPKAEATPAAAPKAKPAARPVAADGKPDLISAPRGGAGDDLKQIRGVGPKLESLLNEMGVWHFDQIAGWRKKEVAWVDNALSGVNKGRVSRDDWVTQAKLLAKGGETEFSKRVKKGDVY